MKISDNLIRLINIIGKEKVIEICIKMKKQIIRFPVHKKIDPEIINIFGERFSFVYEEFKGTQIYFPEAVENEIIKEQIRIDYWINNLSYFDLVKKYERTIDNIRKICKTKPINKDKEGLERE